MYFLKFFYPSLLASEGYKSSQGKNRVQGLCYFLGSPDSVAVGLIQRGHSFIVRSDTHQLRAWPRESGSSVWFH